SLADVRDSPQGLSLNEISYCGMGGGTLANSDDSSGTSPAFDHCAMPAFQTRVARVSWPLAACCCRLERSNGPDWVWPTATWNCAPPGIGGGIGAPAVVAGEPPPIIPPMLFII